MTSNSDCKLCEIKKPLDKTQWIRCEKCKEWYHYDCVGKTASEIADISVFICDDCSPEFGFSILKRVSSRKKAPIDYQALDNGDTIGFLKLHPYCFYFKGSRANFNSNHIKEYTGPGLSKLWGDLRPEDIPEPAIIRRKEYDSLDMSVPSELTVAEVTELLGEDTPLEVMDVATQGNSTGWTLGKWRDYYYLEESERDRIRNVISLEFSYTPLAEKVKRPAIVREYDLVQQVWPSDPSAESDYPKVSLYCLMSVANSFTDFHVDFGGSSVFYHVCQGAKTFLFVPPTPQNLQKYEKWCLSSDQNSTFFGGLVKECYEVRLKKGDSLLIPSGWIHAVYTPEDSLVIGGNFLSKDSIPMELKLAEIERTTRVPRKFRFPYFNRVLWYIVIYYSKPENNKTLKIRLQIGLQYLASYIWKTTNSPDTKEYKALIQALPVEYKKNYKTLAESFLNDLATNVISSKRKQDLPVDSADSKKIKTETSSPTGISNSCENTFKEDV
ncbi:Jhd1p [Sugiyamaella lignohabitans]|uniref:JmjC domain-containing histone demethylation protein 1 n=1 Tax=Sugiyamaella lignohabitans TaxID=796027 RepID=A0A170QZ67_9ASCO|nr:Jhd1p [Sugiyamaella lignohabitans]ANB16003.1 Jhd1p [Sugiyamaella lignohabitans]